VVYFVLIETLMCVCTGHAVSFEDTACVNIRTPWWWHPGECWNMWNRKMCIESISFSVHEKLVR